MSTINKLKINGQEYDLGGGIRTLKVTVDKLMQFAEGNLEDYMAKLPIAGALCYIANIFTDNGYAFTWTVTPHQGSMNYNELNNGDIKGSLSGVNDGDHMGFVGAAFIEHGTDISDIEVLTGRLEVTGIYL